VRVWDWLGVGVGAMFGAWMRWILGQLLNPLFQQLPLGTLVANLSGGFMMGLALGSLDLLTGWPTWLRLAFMTGFLGALTTFSTFSAEMVTLMSRQQYGWAMAGIATHVIGSLAMAGAGWSLMSALRAAG